MSSPKLNEYAILHALNPNTEASFDSLQILSQHMILAAFDRGAKREPFYDVVQKAITLSNAVTIIEFSSRLLRAYVKSEINSPALQDGIAATAHSITHARLALVKQLQELMECPGDEDKIN